MMPPKISSPSLSSSQDINYGIVALEDIHLSFLDEFDEVRSIDKSDGFILVLSRRHISEYSTTERLTIWDSQKKKVLFQNETPYPICEAARFLLPPEILLCMDSEGFLQVIQLHPFEVITAGEFEKITHYTVLSQKNKVQLIAYESEAHQIKFVNVSLENIEIYHEHPASYFFPPTELSKVRTAYEKIECIGICTLPSDKPLIALCVVDVFQKKGFICLVEINPFSNEVTIKEYIAMPNLYSKEDRGWHDKRMACLPDGRLVYAAHYSVYPKNQPIDAILWDETNKILMFTPTETQWSYNETLIGAPEIPDISEEIWQTFPYVLDGENNNPEALNNGVLKAYLPEITAQIPPEEWRILFSLCQNHILYRVIPNVLHQYRCYKITQIDPKFLKRVLGEEIVQALLMRSPPVMMPRPLSEIIASYALDIRMFPPHFNFPKEAALPALVEQPKEPTEPTGYTLF